MTRTGRRQFLGGLVTASLLPGRSWADAGSPAFLSAAATTTGEYVLCGIGTDMQIVFQVPLPDRGHAAAGHPTRPEAVAFARRPGTFAIVIDCATGRRSATLSAPAGRHFFGHGAFSSDGNVLYTTENDYEAGRGRIGVWDAAAGYARIDEWDSGGIGPHDIKRLPGFDVLVVANGGIDTHPESGRTMLNIPTMRPNLAHLDQGALLASVELPEAMHMNSIRHMAVRSDGTVAFGMQWQADGYPSALVGMHRLGGQIDLVQTTRDDVRRMDGYIGSIAFSQDGQVIAATSPRGGLIQLFDADTGVLRSEQVIGDACGIAANGSAFIATSGTGFVGSLGGPSQTSVVHARLQFDNHLVAL